MSKSFVPRVFVEPETSYFLFGPRGTGKSTMTVHRHPDALIIDLREGKWRYPLGDNPDELKQIVSAQPDGATIIIDEIQKIPDLLPIVHLLIEKKRGWKFILTGSSARKLKRQGVDLLGGRALKKELFPFMACELGDRFDLEDALEFGMLPLRFGQPDPAETLMGYVGLYLEEEVKTEGLIRNYDPFIRFLRAMSMTHAGLLNVANVSRECHVKRTTVNDWLLILEDLLISFQINMFTQRAKRELSSHPKFYFFDSGIFRAFRPRSLKDTPQEAEGAALEGLVAQHLMAWNSYTTAQHDIFFWRTRSGVEVDFVIFGELGFWAIEVKNSIQVRPADVDGLVEFQKDYPEAKTLLLYRGEERVMRKDVLCMPADKFLRKVAPNNPLW